jgi:hypothetical protein
MTEWTEFDISEYSFDEFVAFIFAHEPRADCKKQKPWYCNLEVIYDPQKLCAYYDQLFRQPLFLLERFSKAQLEKGFWAIHGATMHFAVSRVIWDTDVPFVAREECVRSMIDLFRLFFATEPLETSSNMWWDSLCYEWHCGNRDRERGGEDLRMQDVMFEALAAILRLNSEPCQIAALHGLGHLHHPGTAALIHTFIAEHPARTAETKEYAFQAAKFDVL